MELYTLDSLLRRTEVVEGFEEMIWAERYNRPGDIQIIAPSTTQFRNLLPSGTYLGLSESDRVMRIKTVLDITGPDGSKKLKISGNELVSVLGERVAYSGVDGKEPNTWSYTSTPGGLIRWLFDKVIGTSSYGVGDWVPFYTAGSLYPAGNIPEDTNTYLIERKIGPLIDIINELSDVWDLGYRLYKSLDTSHVFFNVYKGNDRTSNQSVLPPVLFSESLDSLQNVSELNSTSSLKNAAWVEGKYTRFTVFGNGGASGAEGSVGFDKKLMFVDATDIEYPQRVNVIPAANEEAINKAHGLKQALKLQKDALRKILDKKRFATGEATVVTDFTTWAVSAGLITSGEKTQIDASVSQSTGLEAAETIAYNALLTERAVQELAKNRAVSAFDGEISQLSPYKYNRDYQLGDLVEMRSNTGLTNQMLVSEQIFVSDGEGERAYPTLTMKLFITPGSWLAWEGSQAWADAPSTWSAL